MTLAGEEWVARWGGDRQRWSLPPLPFLPVARLPPPQKRSLSQGTQNSLTQTSGYIVSLCAPFNQVKVTFSPCLSLVAPCEESPGVAPVSPHPADPGFRRNMYQTVSTVKGLLLDLFQVAFPGCHYPRRPNWNPGYFSILFFETICLNLHK